MSRHIEFGGFEHIRLRSEIELLSMLVLIRHKHYITKALRAIARCDLGQAKACLLSYLLHAGSNELVQRVADNIPR